jgi:type II secretory pathway component GspD/PulD (secretin)
MRKTGLPIVVCLLCLSADAADEAAAPAASAPAVAAPAAPAAKDTPPPAPAATTPEAAPAAPAAKEAPAPKVKEVSVPAPKAPTTPAVAPVGSNDLRFNFSGVPLDKVLDYLSEAAGFIVIKEAKVDSNVDVISSTPLNKDEAVDLLNTVLNEKGFAAIRSGRTLTIVKREDARKRDIPVKTGNEPDSIPKTGEMVTQIIPVRHADASQLLENLTPLLAADAVANANKSSNAIVLTDTQINVHRMAEIIKALDTSISAISEVKVFQLNYSKASDTAKLINTLFQTQQGAAGAPAAANNPMAQFFQRMRGGGPGGPGGAAPAAQTQAESAARQAAMRVQAVADDRTNSVVVSAPDEMMPLIEDIVKQIDKVGAPATEIRVFPLKAANSDEMAQVINDSFSQTTTGTGAAAAQSGGGRFFGRFGGAAGGQDAQRVSDTTVHAVSDYRTNSVVVTAESVLMEQIAAMVERLDANPAKQQKVFIYKLENEDAQQVATILQGMISSQTGSTNRASTATRTSTSSTTNRSTTSSSGLSRSTLGR